MRPLALRVVALTAVLAAGEEPTERTVTRRIVDTRFGQVHVRTTRGAGPPLLLLHTEQTERARGLLPPGSTCVDLPDLQLDAFERFPERMAELVRRHFPAGPDRKP